MAAPASRAGPPSPSPSPPSPHGNKRKKERKLRSGVEGGSSACGAATDDADDADDDDDDDDEYDGVNVNIGCTQEAPVVLVSRLVIPGLWVLTSCGCDGGRSGTAFLQDSVTIYFMAHALREVGTRMRQLWLLLS
ncbi:hypothetical protein HZH68_010266 [Vespula germanica]|uniref:Uncharacterized protein n=1 Tax=Vespula germanica TaxID=30212 RepID=A0A834JTX1_VESGE|nr:hypothetical protein HZH68_010266 [Vespula germanica]